MNRNPWQNIPHPKGTEYFKTVLVGPELNAADLPVSWAVDYEGRRAIYFEYPRVPQNGRDINTPSLISMSMRDIEVGPGTRAFAVTLDASGMEDIFYEVCCDLVHAIQEIPPAVTRTMLIRRLERWSNLLKGGSTGMTLEQQRGLYAELMFLQTHAIPTMGEANAIRGWVGPEGGRQDYRFGQTFVEIKSKRGAGASAITISSEQQLYSSEGEQLYLYVLEENEANGNGGKSLTELASCIRDSISSPVIRTEYIGKMIRVGYDFVTRYDTRWTIGKELIYHVDGSFPRLVELDDGISRVRYTIDLGVCVEYMTNPSTLRHDMKGNND